MVNKQTLLLEVDMETGQVVQSIQQLDTEFQSLDKNVEKTSDGVSEMTGHLDKMTGGAVSAFKGMKGGIVNVVKGLKSFKAALAATGIGLLIVAIGSLATYFTKTQRGAEMLEKATAALGAVFDVIVDQVSSIGEGLISAFTDPKQALIDFGNSIQEFVMDKINLVVEGLGLMGGAIMKLFDGDFKGAFDDATKGFVQLNRGMNPYVIAVEAVIETGAAVVETVGEIAVKANAAAKAATNLAERSIALRAAQRDLSKEMAESRAQFKEYNLIAEDTTKGTDERMAAAEKAIDLERNLMAERQRLAQEEVDIQIAKMALSENTEADQQRLVELEVALINIREEAAERLTTVQNKLNTIRTQALTEEEARYARMSELEAALADEKDNEIAALVEEYETKFALAEEFGYGEQELMIMQKEAIAAINKKYADAEAAEQDKLDKAEQAANDKRIADEKRVRDAKFDMARNAVGAVMALNAAFSQKEGEGAERAFKRNKALQIGQALINTAQGITAQLAVPQDALTGQNFIKAGIVAATGAAQIATISKTQFKDDGGVDTGNLSVPRPSESGQATQAPSAVDFGFLGGDSGGPFQAYVVSEQMTTSQQATQQIQDQAALVG